MTEDARKAASPGLTALARRLPREIDPPAQLWERIAARLELRVGLGAQVGTLPREIAPPRDLWPGIAARVDGAMRFRTRARAAAVAAVAALGLAMLALGILDLLGAGNGKPARDADLQSRRTVVDESIAPGARAGDSDGLVWILGAPALSRDVAATLGRELARVRAERLRIERAIDEQPDDVELRELWAYAYETELKLADTCGRAVMAYEGG
jgi:hypothetical protein